MSDTVPAGFVPDGFVPDAVAAPHPEAKIGPPSADTPVTLGDLQADPVGAIKRIGAIIRKDVTDPKLWLTMAASYFGPKMFSAAAPVVGRAAAGAMRLAPEAVSLGATAAGAHLGGPIGAVVGRTVGESLAGRMRPTAAPEVTPSVAEPAASPAHLDLSTRIPASALTPQQIGERLDAARAQGMTAPQPEKFQPIAPRPSVVPEGPPEPSMPAETSPAQTASGPKPVELPKVISPSAAKSAIGIAARRAGVTVTPEAEPALVKAVMDGVTPEDALQALKPMPVESAAAELARRWGTPSDADRRFPPNKSGLPSNPPTARKAHGKVSDLADMK